MLLQITGITGDLRGRHFREMGGERQVILAIKQSRDKEQGHIQALDIMYSLANTCQQCVNFKRFGYITEEL